MIELKKGTINTLFLSVKDDYPQLYDGLRMIVDSLVDLQQAHNTTAATVNSINQYKVREYHVEDYTANNLMTWRVRKIDYTTFEYTILNGVMTVNVYLNDSLPGGTLDTELRIAIPENMKAAQSTVSPMWYTQLGTEAKGYVSAVENSPYMILNVDLVGANWAAISTAIRFTFSFKVKS
jgi:hypothetical protein